MKRIDDFLNSITMYRLLLYYLIALVLFGLFFATAGLLSFNPVVLIVSTLFLLAVSMLTNSVFASVYEAHTNVESVYISALILALIVSPAKNLHELIFLGWAATLTTSSKYILTIKKKHIFNPVAIAIALTAIVLGQSATWWVGTAVMVPFVFLGGVLIVRKIQREDLFYSFIVAACVTMLTFSVFNGTNTPAILQRILFGTPILFFGFVMLTEPLTTPPTKQLQIMYGAMVGLLFAPQIHIGSLYTTPELALLTGNIFSYLVSPKEKLMLKLKQTVQLAPDIFDFVFSSDTKFSFRPGEYMEWTLSHPKPDDRGNRRYFTIASSPTEPDIRIGIRFYSASSTYKKSMFGMTPGSTIVAAQRAGDFVLPANPAQKLVYIAGGIGITPFRSHIKYLIDTNGKRDIVLFYSNKTATEIVYKDVFDAGARAINLKTVYTLTDTEHVPSGWTGKTGRITPTMITAELPDYRERLFYLSGPSNLVNGFKDVLQSMGVKNDMIKTDFFPGFVA